MVFRSIPSLLLHGVSLIPFYLTLTSAQEAPSGLVCLKDEVDWDSVRSPSFCIKEVLTPCRSPPAMLSTGPLVMKRAFVRG
jgi:hypothetical protein